MEALALVGSQGDQGSSQRAMGSCQPAQACTADTEQAELSGAGTLWGSRDGPKSVSPSKAHLHTTAHGKWGTAQMASVHPRWVEDTSITGAACWSEREGRACGVTGNG